MTVVADTQLEPGADSIGRAPGGAIVRLNALFAVAFLIVGAALLLVAYSGIAWPEAWAGSSVAEYLTYGRVLPMATAALILGWLTFGLIAAIYHFLPVLLETELEFRPAATASTVLMAFGVGSGIGAIGAGAGAGGRLLEMPWYSDAALAVSFLMVAVVVATTVARAGRDRIPVPVWYFLASSWWLFLAFTTGAIPGLAGAPAELQSAFTTTAIVGMWIASAGVGVGYALVARLLPGAEFHPRLGRIGFWSLGLLWAWTAARTLQYGPMADWMETIPVLFTAALVVAVLTIAADFAWAMRGRWEEIGDAAPLGTFAMGMGMFVVVPLLMVVQSLRSSSAILRFTGWDAAFDIFVLMGVFTLWVMAALEHVLADGSGRNWGRRLGTGAGVAVLGGVLFAVGTRWVAGFQQGYAWLAGVESGAYQNTGEDFYNTVAPLHGTDVLTAIGVAVAALGVLMFTVGAVRRLAPTRSGVSQEQLQVAWPDDERPVVIRRGAAAVFALAVITAFVFPAIDADADPSVLADESRNLASGTPAAEGRDIYIAEGCWYCHTQQVRAIVTDVGLGPVSTAGDYAHDPVGTFGVSRIGPDLAHAGSRAPTNDPAWIASHLVDPRADRPWSVMPSYAHLSPSELTSLAAYVAGLE